MMKLSIDRKKINIATIFVLLTVLFNDNTLIVATSLSNEEYAFVSLGLYTVMFLAFSFKRRKTVINSGVLAFVVAALLCIFITSLFNFDFHLNHGLIIFELIQATIVVCFVSYDDYIRDYVKIISILATISLVMLILTSVIPAILSFAKIVYNSQHVGFYSFFLYFRSTNESFRNYGFLTEPGDYQHYLNIALLFYLYFIPNNEKKKWVPIVLTMTVLSTFSPAGMVFCALIWLSHILAYFSNFKKTASSLFGVMILLIISFSIESLRERILDYTVLKLVGMKSSSLGIRISGITSGIKCFCSNPFFGNGFTKGTEMMEQNMLSQGFAYHQTSTTAALLAFFGLPLTVLFTVPYVKAFIPKSRITKVSIIILAIGILFSINNERYVWDLPYYIFMMYGVCGMIKKKNILIEEK